jgi:hypothetical protein
MGALKFLCPTTGNEVDTGIDLDPASFASLPREVTPLACSHCNQPHILAGVSAWLGERQLEYERRAEADAPPETNFMLKSGIARGSAR